MRPGALVFFRRGLSFPLARGWGATRLGVGFSESRAQRVMIVLAFARDTIYLDPGVEPQDDAYEKVRNTNLNNIHKR